MKIILHDAPDFISEQGKSELFALQTCVKQQVNVELIDYFTDEQGNTYFV